MSSTNPDTKASCKPDTLNEIHHLESEQSEERAWFVRKSTHHENSQILTLLSPNEEENEISTTLDLCTTDTSTLYSSNSSSNDTDDFSNIHISAHSFEPRYYGKLFLSENYENRNPSYSNIVCNSGLQSQTTEMDSSTRHERMKEKCLDSDDSEDSHGGNGLLNGLRDLEMLLKSSQNVPLSPLHSFNHSNRVNNESIHNVSSQIHHLSLINTSMPSSLPENEFDPVATSKNHLAGHMDFDQVPERVQESLLTHIMKKDVDNLLHVLLSISEKYDFSQLNIRMMCDSTNVNPNVDVNASLCYDYLTKGVCSIEQSTGACKLKHVTSNHIDVLIDKIRNGNMPICLIRQQGSQYVVADMPSVNGYPGEQNPYALPHSDICQEYSLRGVCPNDQIARCPYRHLIDCHPERVALLYRYGQITEFESTAWKLTPCVNEELNPFSNPSGPTCYDFHKYGYCKQNREGKICRFRHCKVDRS